MNRKIVIATLVAALVLMLTGLVWADQGAAKPEGQRVGYLQQGIFQQLTPEQREQLKDKIAAMKESGASKEEIHKAVVEMLKDWGVKPKALERWGKGIMQQLTAEQREQLKEKVKALREKGAAPQEIREVVAKMFKEWGIKPPAWPQQQAPRWQAGRGQQWGQPGVPPRWGQQAGPPRWGQQAAPPPRWGQQAGPPRWGWQAGPPRWGQQAAPPRWGQQAGPPRWGQQAAPPRWGQQQQAWRGQQAQRPWWQMMMQRLTPDQREQIKTKIAELREQGADSQEIRETVRGMLEDWGIRLPFRSN